jgi:hypothetical protein
MGALFEAADVATGEVIPFRRSGGLDLPGRATATALLLPEDLPEADWTEVGRKLHAVERSVMWWLGDWWAFGQERGYGERKQVVEDESWDGPSYQTCMNAASVARRLGTSLRREVVPWSVHKELAPLVAVDRDGQVVDDTQARELLDRAAAEGWTVREAKAAVGRVKAARAIGALVPGGDTCTTADLWTLVGLGQRFGTIYADPPWLYDNQGTTMTAGAAREVPRRAVPCRGARAGRTERLELAARPWWRRWIR